jgi:hypothetical protein
MYERDAFQEVPQGLDGIAVDLIEVEAEGGKGGCLHDLVTASGTVPEDQLRVLGGGFVFLALSLLAG